MKRIRWFDIAVIFAVGLLPVLWLPGNTVLLGHDAGLALDPIMHFLDRIHVWSQRFSIGTDQNGALLGAFFIHGLEAFLAYIGLNLHFGQVVQFIFWFTLPGFAMYYFAHKTFPGKRYLPLIASVIYMLNFYLIQGWFVAERTKFSIYIAFPLVLYFLIQYLTKRSGFLKTAVISGIVLGIFNGGGSLPLYGGLVFTILLVMVYFNALSLNIETLKRSGFYLVGVGLFYLAFNAYWLIPYFFYILGFFGRDLAAAGGVEGALSWAKYLSSESTFINLFRGQGIPDWYLNPYHAYSQLYLNNPILIIASFLFPILAFASLIIAKVRKESFLIYLLVLISLVGIVFSSGPQSQFGFIFEFLVNYVPGFAMFRSAFFKFNYMLWFSYAVLIGFTLDYIFSRAEIKYFKKYALTFSKFVLILFVISYTLYHFPVLDGSFLNYSREPGKELTTRVEVPDYVFEFGEWMKGKDPNARYLIFPQLGDNPYISYNWKYWSIAPVTSLLSRNSFVQNSQLAGGNEKVLMSEMYADFLRNDMESFLDFTEVFAIDGIVIQKDYDWNNPNWGTINPALYKKVLKSHPDLFIHEKTFGQWEAYRIAERQESLRVNSSTKLTFLQGKLGKVVSFPNFEPKSPLFMSDIEGKNIDYYARSATELYLAPECIQCDLEYKERPFEYYNPKLLPGSILYPLVTLRENQTKPKNMDYIANLNYSITLSNRRIIEIKWMVDSGRRIEEILPTIARYREALRLLGKELAKEQSSATLENRGAQMVMNHIAQQVNLIDSAYNEPILSIFQRQALSESYNEILEIQRIANERLWVTEDTQNKRYIYDLPLTGDYEIFVKRGSLTNPQNDPKDTTLKLKGSSSVLKPQETIGDWLSFGRVNLSSPKTFIELNDGTMSNLINGASLQLPDGREGIIMDNNNITFTVDSLNKCFHYQFRDLEFLNTQYVISFSYRNFSDDNKLGFFNQSEGDEFLKYSIKNATLPTYRYLTKFNKLITPKDGNVRLTFCNGFLSISEIGEFEKELDVGLLPEGRTLIEIKNIQFHKVAYPNIVLYRKQKDVKDKNSVISYVKKSPVTYEIDLAGTEEPSTLIMRESFGKYWQLCDKDNTCLPFEDKAHFQTGGFANAWYLKDFPIDGKITLYYYPQRWYQIGTVITLLSIAAVVGGICLYIFRKK